MKHAQALIDRILYFDGAPNMQRYMKINVGRPSRRCTSWTSQLEQDAVARLNKGIELARAKGDNGTRLPARGDPEERGGAHRLARGPAPPDPGDRGRELPGPADRWNGQGMSPAESRRRRPRPPSAGRARAPARPPRPGPGRPPTRLLHPDETHLRNLRQLTFGGENAEAYWSPDGRELIFQSTPRGRRPATSSSCSTWRREPRAASPTGKGRTTCGYFYDGGRARALRLDPSRRRPSARRGPTSRRATCGRCTRATTSSRPGPTAATSAGSPSTRATTPRPRSRPMDGPWSSPPCATGISRSTRWRSTARGVRRLTREPGYDGGAFFSPDGTRIVYRRDAPPRRRGPRPLPRAAGLGALFPGRLSRSG